MPRDDSYNEKAASIVREVEEVAVLYGWSFERLYNGFWQKPRGLAAVLENTDSIASIDENVCIIRTREGHTSRFFRETNGY